MSIDWKPGKQGLAKTHRSLVADNPSRSVDLDGCFKTSHPSAPRWDYVLERKSTDRRGAGVEVHAGNVNQVPAMIELFA